MTAPPAGARRLPFTVALRQPVLGVTTRAGWLIQGDAGWAEWSPLPSWSREENAAAYLGALEAAGLLSRDDNGLRADYDAFDVSMRVAL